MVHIDIVPNSLAFGLTRTAHNPINPDNTHASFEKAFTQPPVQRVQGKVQQTRATCRYPRLNDLHSQTEEKAKRHEGRNHVVCKPGLRLLQPAEQYSPKGMNPKRLSAASTKKKRFTLKSRHGGDRNVLRPLHNYLVCPPGG